MRRIRRALAVALVAFIALSALTIAAPAAGAHGHKGGDDAPAPMEMYGGEPGADGSGDPDRNGVDGTDPIAFVALLVAGIATVGAVAALIFGPRRVPA